MHAEQLQAEGQFAQLVSQGVVDLAPDEPLKLRVFIDRCIVEVFVNGRQCLTARVIPIARTASAFPSEA